MRQRLLLYVKSIVFYLGVIGFQGIGLAVAEGDRLLPLDVVVNSSKSGTWLLLEHAGQLYAEHEAFEEWRVRFDTDSPSLLYKGKQYWLLEAVPGYKAKLNISEQSLELLFAPQAFTATTLIQEVEKRPVLSPALTALFFNYDGSYTHAESRSSASIDDLGLLGELGFSSGMGVLTNSFSARNLAHDSMLGSSGRFVRLETTFTRDFPNHNKTLRLGDSATRTGLLGRNVYFGGIQFGSNFALTPGFVTQPVPVLNGLSAAPSTVELYINDVLRQTSTVPTGPFAIDNLPALTGNGDARIIVRDQLGRETVITQSFFSNSRLLSPGLDDWSVEAGAVRRDLSNSSGHYGPAFASGTWRHGYSRGVTVEGRTELTPNLATLETGVVAGLPLGLLASAAVTGSHGNKAGNGAQWLLGLEYSKLRSSIYIQAQGASRDFRQLGELDNFAPIKSQLAANWTYSSEHWGSFGLGFASLQRYGSVRVDTYSANYSFQLGGNATFNVVANQVEGDLRATSIGFTLLLLLDHNRLASAVVNTRNGVNDVYATLAQNPNYENRLGWRALVGEQQNHGREEAGLLYLGQRGTFSADFSHSPAQTNTRLSASGGMVFADGEFFVTERLVDSFALAEVPGYGNVGVGLGSNTQSYTNASGIAMIPRLSPYQNNQIRLNATDLPINAELDSIEQYVVPAWRSAVKVKFPVRSGRGALLSIVLDDGDFAPAGAIVHIEGDPEEFYVARHGQAFVTGLQLKNRVALRWNDQQCSFEVTLPPENADEIPRLKPLICKGISR